MEFSRIYNRSICMVTTANTPEKLLRAFPPSDRDWHTASELQRSLDDANEKFSIDDLIEATDELAGRGLLNVIFTTPHNRGRTGFVARLTVAGRAYLGYYKKANRLLENGPSFIRKS
jgi:hypothetical protein